MKRSEINKQLCWAVEACRKLQFNLPSFAFWTANRWQTEPSDIMRRVMLGWDVTDYNSGDFDRIGAVLFTLRNGSVYDTSVGTPYCEKLIMMKAGQKLPFHFHYSKTEDIINRCGGTLCVRVFNSNPDYTVDTKSDVQLRLDGVPVSVPAGGFVEVTKGNSITLTPTIYHEFWAKQEDGDLLIGEVSSVNDDRKDNHFMEELKLSPIVEDEEPLYPLCNGYVQ